MGSRLERILGFAEGAVGAVERLLLVAAPSVESSDQPGAFGPRAARRFDVLEVIEPTGELSWVVSNGEDRATCNSAAFAERVKVSLG
jgi:hypothetical protein